MMRCSRRRDPAEWVDCDHRDRRAVDDEVQPFAVAFKSEADAPSGLAHAFIPQRRTALHSSNNSSLPALGFMLKKNSRF
jgi:hypothetical protein